MRSGSGQMPKSPTCRIHANCAPSAVSNERTSSYILSRAPWISPAAQSNIVVLFYLPRLTLLSVALILCVHETSQHLQAKRCLYSEGPVGSSKYVNLGNPCFNDVRTRVGACVCERPMDCRIPRFLQVCREESPGTANPAGRAQPPAGIRFFGQPSPSGEL